MIPCYVAGRTTELDKVREVQDVIKQLGGTISHDWTRAAPEDALRGGGAGAAYNAVPHAQKQKFAEDDLLGVRNASLVVAVCGPGWVGTLIEIGFALAHNTPVWLIGAPERESVFYHLVEVTRLQDLVDFESMFKATMEIDRELSGRESTRDAVK
jgi:hypothetical protein